MSENENETPASVAITMDRVLEVLEKGEVSQEFGLLRWSSNYAFLIALTYEDLELTAVYKPQQGERPLWDFPDGTLCKRERAAFLTSQVLKWDIVPPTALREASRGLGTIQFYIDHDPQINYFCLDESTKPQLARFQAFDYVVNNADRKGGHCLVDSDGHMWGIDHGITFHASNKLRTVIWDYADQPVPNDLLADLESLLALLENPESSYRRELELLLDTTEIRAFRSRLRNLLKTRRYPVPGPGPNYPWPPV